MILPGEGWQVAGQGYRGASAGACNAAGEVYFIDAPANKLFRIGLDGGVKEFLADAGQANALTVGAKGELYTVSRQTGKVMCYDSTGAGRQVADGLRGNAILAMPDGSLYVTVNGEVWQLKDGQKTKVDSGLKRATGLANRPDQWLLSVADGASKWVYSYQIDPPKKRKKESEALSTTAPQSEHPRPYRLSCSGALGAAIAA